MASEIESIIEEIEDYLDSCKTTLMSANKIIVNRDDITALIDELKTKTPIEIKRYQKIISNQEAILADAKKKADAIIQEAQVETTELVSEHEIMRQAYAQANEVVEIANRDASDMVTKATNDANEIRLSAIAYTDELLKKVQDIIAGSMETTRTRMESYLSTMKGYLDTVVQNRLELSPNPAATVLDVPDSREQAPKAQPKAAAPVQKPAPSIAGNPAAKTATVSSTAQAPAKNNAAGNNAAANNPAKPTGTVPIKSADDGKKQKSGIDVPEKFFNKD